MTLAQNGHQSRLAQGAAQADPRPLHRQPLPLKCLSPQGSSPDCTGR
jgi:hypothetical protein